MRERGLSTSQIADELNVSRDTATWLLAHSKEGPSYPAPKDIHVDWRSIGKSAYRLRCISQAMADIILETLDSRGGEIDLVVGVEVSGIPLACMIAEELGVEFAIYHPNKQLENGGGGTFSQNFASVDEKECVIVDDVITTGTTTREILQAMEERGARPRVICVMIDKKGLDEIDGVPIKSLLQIARTDRTE